MNKNQEMLINEVNTSKFKKLRIDEIKHDSYIYRDPMPGVYIYILVNKEEEIVYVGQTKDIYDRIYSHKKSNKNFEIAFCKSVSKDISNLSEAFLIYNCQPKYNKSIPTNLRYVNINRIKEQAHNYKGVIDAIIIGKYIYVNKSNLKLKTK